MSVQRIIEDYLGTTGYLETPTLGGKSKIKPDPEAAEKLRAQLEKERRLIVVVLTGFYLATFAVGVAAFFNLKDHSGWFHAGIGGSLITVTLAFQRFWQEKTMIDIILQQFPNLTPEELIKVLGNIREFFLKKKK